MEYAIAAPMHSNTTARSASYGNYDNIKPKLKRMPVAVVRQY